MKHNYLKKYQKSSLTSLLQTNKVGEKHIRNLIYGKEHVENPVVDLIVFLVLWTALIFGSYGLYLLLHYFGATSSKTFVTETINVIHFLTAYCMIFAISRLLFTAIHMVIFFFYEGEGAEIKYSQSKSFIASAFLWGALYSVSKYIFADLQDLPQDAAATAETGALGMIFEKWLSASTAINRLKVIFASSHNLIQMTILAIFYCKCLIAVQKLVLFIVAYDFSSQTFKERIEKNGKNFKIFEKLLQNYNLAGSGKERKTAIVNPINYYEGFVKKAEETAETLFYEVVRAVGKMASETVQLTVVDIEKILTHDEAETLMKATDVDGSGSISLAEFKNGFVSTYNEKLNLLKGERDGLEVVLALDDLLILLARCIMVFAVARAFGFTLVSSGIAGLGTGVFAILSIKETITDISRSFIFLFFVHPYDIGDSVLVDGKAYMVLKIGFLVTTFKGDQDAVVYAKNSSLNGAIIMNHRRSDDQYESVPLLLDPATTYDQLDALEDKMNEFLLQNPKQFHPKVSMGPVTVESKTAMKISVGYRHRSNFQDGGLYGKRCSIFNAALYEKLGEVGIKFGNKY